ncbi:MAG: class I SAM-dependent methyltransferase [bacterium]|nr:class I SAM-dependent methyltransferase [bacterium]
MDPQYGARYRELYDRHWWWRAREEMIVDLLARLEPPGGYGPILDVGCGDALSFPYLRRFGEPEGIEADGALVSAQAQARGPIHIGPFDETFRTDRRYGLITMLDVIEHLDDLAALRRAAALLAPGGLVVITVPAFRLLWTAHDDFNHHRRRYTAAGLVRVARRAGLVVRSRRTFFHWLFPLKLLVRLKEGLVAGPPRMAEVPSPWVNRLFHGLSRLEQRTWGRLSWPLGSSLVAVCSLPEAR